MAEGPAAGEVELLASGGVAAEAKPARAKRAMVVYCILTVLFGDWLDLVEKSVK